MHQPPASCPPLLTPTSTHTFQMKNNQHKDFKKELGKESSSLEDFYPYVCISCCVDLLGGQSHICFLRSLENEFSQSSGSMKNQKWSGLIVSGSHLMKSQK